MDADVIQLVKLTIEEFGRIDILINNAGALIPQKTEELSMKQYDLMQEISVRGAFHLSKLCIPYLKKSPNPHVIFMVPPVNLKVKVFLQAHLGYTMSKFGVGMMMQGLAAEFEGDIAFNSLWPRTAIDTNAIRNVTRSAAVGQLLRTPEIMGKAAVKIFESDYEKFTGNAFIEDEVLIGSGEYTMDSINQFNVEPATPDYILVPDLLL
jgi:citronellol/citronellal dehydrogenase